MIRIAMAIIMILGGMTPAISCESAFEDSVQLASIVSDQDHVSEANLTVSQPCTNKENESSMPCAYCSPICHHAVTLVFHSLRLPVILDASTFIDFQLDAYSSIDLDSPKEPPRFS